MGLWGSKQQKDLSVSNPEPIGQVFVTDDALKNVIKTVESDNAKKSPKQEEQKKDQQQQQQAQQAGDLYDKRLLEYERNLVKGFNTASREVEELFRDRYRTLPVCADIQKRVSECYSSNTSAPLKCVDIAQEFVKCVERERQAKFGLPPTNTKATAKLNGA